MKKHVAALGLIYGLIGLLQVFGAVMIGLFGVGGGMAAAFGNGQGTLGLGMMLGVAGLGFAGIVLCFAAITLLTAWGLLTRATWGRWLGVIASVLHVLSFSWISLFGLYGLWALLSKESHEVFGTRA